MIHRAGVAAASLTGTMQLTLLLNWFVRTSAEMENMAAAGVWPVFLCKRLCRFCHAVFSVQRIMKWITNDTLQDDRSASSELPPNCGLTFSRVCARYDTEGAASASASATLPASASLSVALPLALIDVSFCAKARFVFTSAALAAETIYELSLPSSVPLHAWLGDRDLEKAAL